MGYKSRSGWLMSFCPRSEYCQHHGVLCSDCFKYSSFKQKEKYEHERKDNKVRRSGKDSDNTD